jgi:predicted Zn-dependent peptidase
MLDATRTRARYAFLTALDDPANAAYALGAAIRRGGDPGALDRFQARYDAVTADDVAAATRKWLGEDGLTVVRLAEKAAPEPTK